MRVVVIGAGLGGLSAACHLAGREHDVTVVERGPIPGGRAGVIERAGYRMDTGPCVMTMPGLLRDVFAAAGADMDDHVTLRPVDPMYRAVYPDGSSLRVRHGRDAMTEEIRAVCGPAEAAAFGPFCDWLGELYRLEMPDFIDRNFDSPLDYVTRLGTLVRIIRMGGLRSVHRKVASFFDDERLHKLFSFQAMYAGLSPFDALAIYCVITYMDSVEGVFFPDGGMHRMATGLEAAATAAGAQFRYGTAVARIEVSRSGGTRGVHLADGTFIPADAVVANPDLPIAYRDLLDVPTPRVAARGRYSPSCMLWLAGVRGAMPEAATHHNIHFGSEWEGAFTDLLDRGTTMRDPSILVTAPSLSDPSMAPEGATSLYVLEPAPNLDGTIDWRGERARRRDDLVARVGALGYPVEVETETYLDPVDWAEQGMERGTPFALAHTFFQTGAFRAANRDRRIPGVFFTGSSTTPGVGVPMVLISGRLAAERVRAWDRSRRRT
ncbi:MAG: phytoene desaturase family protein [Actinomycetes bacterium]